MNKLDGFDLESRVGDIKDVWLEENNSWSTGTVLWSTADLPEVLLKNQISDLVYLGSPIDAVTSRSYLDSLDSSTRIYDLFNVDDLRFFPVEPNGLTEA